MEIGNLGNGNLKKLNPEFLKLWNFKSFGVLENLVAEIERIKFGNSEILVILEMEFWKINLRMVFFFLNENLEF